MITRRVFLTSVAAAMGSAAITNRAAALRPSVSAQPDPANFQSGDLIWPKKRNAYVPYHAGSSNTAEQDAKQWARERDEYVARMKALKLDELERARVERLRKMTYREFISLYTSDPKQHGPTDYSGGSLSVGHVGIVDVDEKGIAHVVEAMQNSGVIRSTYQQWLSGRTDQLIWHGRIKDLNTQARAKVVAEACGQLGKPYDFWNFDLADERGFYCSKLVWFSVHKALGLAVDGNKNSRRLLWFSPKQLLYVDRVNRLHDPGPYGRT